MSAEARAHLALMMHAPHTLHRHLPLNQSTWTAAVMAVLPQQEELPQGVRQGAV